MKTQISFLTFACLLFTFTAGAEPAEPHSWDKTCAALKSVDFPKADQPTGEQLKGLKDCDGAGLYYGIGMAVNDEKARLCAFAQRKAADNDLMFGGSSLLMMIYANGRGVKQNIPLAEKIVCDQAAGESGMADMEIEGRLEHLDTLKRDKTKTFDYCDDITSGYMQGHCASLQDSKDAVGRKANLEKLTSQWTANEKDAFKSLQAASKAFTDVRSSNEIDLSGSGRAAFEIAEQSIQERDFIESLEKLEAKKAPTYTSKQRQDEDKKMAELLKKIEGSKKADDWGTITKEQIKSTQKAWVAYRDAWVAFAKVKYPGVPSDSVAAWLTKKRNHMLRSFT